MNNRFATLGLVLGLLCGLVVAPVSAASTVRITPDYLRRIYQENLTLYSLTDSDSATITFSRGTVERVEDLRKLHEARRTDFVKLVLTHVKHRVTRVDTKIQESPISAEEPIGQVLPSIYEQIHSRLSKLMEKPSTKDARWRPVVEATRRTLGRIREQLKGPGTKISAPDE
jgi:cellulose biosynthesis protein BcsQ